MSKILALDYGEKHIGIAISDPERKWAFPYGKIEVESREQVIEEINKICQEEGIELVVIGLPFSLKNNHQPKVEEIKNFMNDLEKKVNIPYDFEDERLTTRGAEALLKESGQKNLKKKVDKTAAVLILQSYLERKENR